MPPGRCAAPHLCARIGGASVGRSLPWMLGTAVIDRDRRHQDREQRRSCPPPSDVWLLCGHPDCGEQEVKPATTIVLSCAGFLVPPARGQRKGSEGGRTNRSQKARTEEHSSAGTATDAHDRRTHGGYPMHVVIRQYKVDSNATEEIVRRAREGFVPLISSAPGFVSYTMVDAGADGLITVSIFEDRAGAEESVRMAANWSRETLASLLPNPPQVTIGEVSIREIKENVRPGYGVMRRYKFNPGDVAEVTRRVREGLVPQITSAPGFGIYTVLDAGEGVVVSLSAFTDRASAEASTQQALAWAREHLGSFHPQPPQVISGEIKVREARSAAATG